MHLPEDTGETVYYIGSVSGDSEKHKLAVTDQLKIDDLILLVSSTDGPLLR